MNRFLVVLSISTLFAHTTAGADDNKDPMNPVWKSRFTLQELKQARVPLIPYPQNVTWKEGDLALYEMNVTYPSHEKDDYATAVSALEQWAAENGIGITHGTGVTGNVRLRLTEHAGSGHPEGYELYISEKGVDISAMGPPGLFYAIQTLRQLSQRSGNRISLPFCDVEDWPAFAFRGFMIDVGRNFQTLESLREQIDIMARYKLNVFHLHLTDRPAWRIESKAYPQLIDPFNHRPTRDPGQYYTYAELRSLIDYARSRHITVIPEIDMPGHSDSFKKAMGVTMESEQGMTFLEEILKEFFTEIPREMCPYIHIGSDEVHIDNPVVFMKRMTDVCKAFDRQIIVWSPGLETTDDVIRQNWGGKETMKKGRRNIDSINNYINNGEPLTYITSLFFRQVCDTSAGSDDYALGGILCLWPDVNLEEEEDAFRQNPVYPGLVTWAQKTWTAGVLDSYPGYYFRMPEAGSLAWSFFDEFESRLLAHGARFFTDQPFPYYRQTGITWRLTGPFENHGDYEQAFPPEQEIRDTYHVDGREYRWIDAEGGTIVIRHRFGYREYFPDAQTDQTVYALTYIFAETEGDCRFRIGFETPLRANRAYAGIPKRGTWDANGGKIWINDQPLEPPVWRHPGWHPEKLNGWGSPADQEIPWFEEELYWTRKPVAVHLEKGWNRVLIKIPCRYDSQNWMFTFVPVENSGGIKFSRQP